MAWLFAAVEKVPAAVGFGTDVKAVEACAS